MSTRLERAVHDLIHGSREGLGKIAEWLRKPESTLRREANPHDKAAKLGFVDVVEATTYTGNLVALNAFAAEAGCMVFKLPETVRGDTFHDLAAMATEFSDLVGAVSKATKDRRVTDCELHKVEKEAGELIAAVQATLQHLAAANSECKRGHLTEAA